MTTESVDYDGLDDSALVPIYAGPDETRARAALATLLKKHEAALRAAAHGRAGGNRDVIEAAYSKTCEELIQNRLRFDHTNPDYTWLAWAKSLTIYNAIDEVRKECRRLGLPDTPIASKDPLPRPPTAPRQLEQEPGEGGMASFEDRRTQSPFDEAMLLELREKYRECLKGLPNDPKKPLRLIYVLRHHDGRTLKAIGDPLGLAINTVKRRYKEAEDLMKDCLRKKLGGEYQ